MVAALKEYEKTYNVKITFSVETEPLGTAGPLALAREILAKDDSPFFVLNSDIICDYPFEQLRDFHLSHGNEGTIVVSCAEPRKSRKEVPRMLTIFLRRSPKSTTLPSMVSLSTGLTRQ